MLCCAQILAADDWVTMPGGEVVNLWYADPWSLIQQVFPARVSTVTVAPA